MAPEGLDLGELRAEHFQEHLPGTFEAERLFSQLQAILARCERSLPRGCPAFQAASWTLISRELLTPSLPWPIHELLYTSAFCRWDEASLGPPPVWTPLPGQATETNIGLFLRNHGSALLREQWNGGSSPATAFPALQRLSYDNPELYWPRVLQELNVVFHRRPDKIADFSAANEGMPGGRWLPGASLNIAESCVLATADGRRSDDRLAIVWRDEAAEGAPPGGLGRRTLREVRQLSRQVAAGLLSLGLGPGAPVGVYLPMSPDSVCCYLGILLAGGTVVSVAESFSAAELASRLHIAGARAVITQDFAVRGGKRLPIYSRVVEANAPLAIVLQCPNRDPAQQEADFGSASAGLRPGDVLFEELVERGREREPVFVPPAMASDFPCNVLFSSGTTGTPKAIPWSQATPIKAAADAFFQQDLKPGDVAAWPTSLGWMMGPWLIFGALVNGASIALYQGNPATPGFLRFVQDAGVTMLGVIPSLVRAWKGLKPGRDRDAPLDWSALRAFSSTGEASTPGNMLWLMSRARYQAPVMEYCGGTEIGGAFVTGCRVQPQGLSCFSTPTMGCRLVIIDEDKKKPQVEGVCVGECALMPRMLGASATLLNADNFEIYFKGMPTFQGQLLRRHGDAFERMAKGYYRAHGRIDDTMNLGGIKVSSVEIERICNLAHASIVETAAVGLPPAKGGPEELVLFVVLKPGAAGVGTDELAAAFTQHLKNKLNPLFKVSHVRLVKELPRTATNKVLRRQLRDAAVRQLPAASRARL